MSNDRSTESTSGSSSDSEAESSEHTPTRSLVAVAEGHLAGQEEPACSVAQEQNAGDNAIDGDEYVEILNVDEEEEDGTDSGPNPGSEGYPPTYWLGRTIMTEEKLDKCLIDGWMNVETRSKCRVPGNEKVPHPEPYCSSRPRP